MDELVPKDSIYTQFASFETEKRKIWPCQILVGAGGNTHPLPENK